MVSENAVTNTWKLLTPGYGLLVKVYNTIVILIELYKCPTLLILQKKDRFVFVSEQKETSDEK